MTQENIQELYKNNGLVYYTPLEEVLNTLSHASGILFGLIGMVFMLLKASSTASVIVAVLTALGFMILFVASTAYHAAVKLNHKRVLRKLDYCAINFLVLSCGTGPCLLYGNTAGYVVYALSWALSIAVIALCFINFEKFRKWAIVSIFIVSALMAASFVITRQYIPKIALEFYVSGLTLVIIGAITFGIKKKYAHSLFHIFVLMGPVCFFMSNYFQLA